VEIEDDVIRFRRRSLEFEHDVRAALIAGRPGLRRLMAHRLAGAVLGVFARWRWQRSRPPPPAKTASPPGCWRS